QEAVIRVEKEQISAAALPMTAVARRRSALVSLAHIPHAGECPGNASRVVTGPVVDDHDLGLRSLLPDHAPQGLAEILRLVVAGNDDGDLGHGGSHRRAAGAPDAPRARKIFSM